MDRMQKGPSYNSSAAMYPENPESAHRRYSLLICGTLFFPSGLDPVLDRGEGDKDAVVPPYMPGGLAIRKTIIDDKPYGRIEHAACVTRTGDRQVGHVGVEVDPAMLATVLGVRNQDIPGSPGMHVAQVMQEAFAAAVAVATPAASGTAATPEMPRASANRCLG
jgi:hypothetical protein